MKNKIHSLDDEQLIALCRIGDDEAYSVLVARYLFTVRNRASVYNNSGIDFEDLVQEGFIGLLNAVKCYESNFDTSFSTFAYLCIDRNILSAVRKSLAKKQIPKSALSFIEDEQNLQENISRSPEEILIAKENLSAMKQKIAEILSDTERKVLDLYLLGYSYSKIAEKLELSEKSVDNAIQRMRKKLK
ncbi:MAG: sigma-70 family RNA polymerase sigma factor [Clostridia bacterium]|nr:sigma-70 family RNA polymerase sigma factor [Clostridia bacterium]